MEEKAIQRVPRNRASYEDRVSFIIKHYQEHPEAVDSNRQALHALKTEMLQLLPSCSPYIPLLNKILTEKRSDRCAN